MISSNVVIITNDELEKIKNEWFQKGVQRGRFEERLIASAEKPYYKDCITQGVAVRITDTYEFSSKRGLIGIVGVYSNTTERWQVYIKDPQDAESKRECWVPASDLEILS